MNVYEMYLANNKKYGFWIVRNSWGNIMAKVIEIEGVKEGGPIVGKLPYFDNPAVRVEIYTQQQTGSEIPGTFKEIQFLSGPGTYSYHQVKV